MPLCINGVIVDKLPPDTTSLLEAYPSLKEYSRELLSQPRKVVGAVGSLYVHQREYAIVTPNDRYINFVGTDSATTCHMVVVRHPETGMTACGHFDGSGREECIKEMVRKVQEYALRMDMHGELELHLVGGFLDKKGFSTELCQQILYSFHRQPANIHLVTACVCELNNTVRGGINLPMVTGIGVNVKTGDIFPASFLSKGPDLPLRSSRLLAGGSPEMLEIYDTFVGYLKIGPFNYEPVRGIVLWLSGGDELILNHLSTSPEAEDANFVPETRRALAFIQEHPFPSITVFPEGRPRYYRKDEYGQWAFVTQDNGYYGHEVPLSNGNGSHMKPKTFSPNHRKQ